MEDPPLNAISINQQSRQLSNPEIIPIGISSRGMNRSLNGIHCMKSQNDVNEYLHSTPSNHPLYYRSEESLPFNSLLSSSLKDTSSFPQFRALRRHSTSLSTSPSKFIHPESDDEFLSNFDPVSDIRHLEKRYSPPIDPDELATFLGESLQILIDDDDERPPMGDYKLHRHSLPHILDEPSPIITTPSGITIRNGQAFLPNGAPLTVVDIAQMNSLLQGNPNLLQSVPKKISLYKTELCRTFEETGYCRYGMKCQFAHDKTELRTIPRHPRYKTEICRTFWEQGNCPYGKRCCFIHLEAGAVVKGNGDEKSDLDNNSSTPPIPNDAVLGKATAPANPIGRPYRSHSFVGLRSHPASLSPRLSVPMIYADENRQPNLKPRDKTTL